MSLELLGAVEVQPPLAAVVPIGTEAQRIDAEEMAIADAYREASLRRLFSAPVIIGASIGGMVMGPFGALIGGFVGGLFDQHGDAWREALDTRAAQKSATLTRARQALARRSLAEAELKALEHEQEADDEVYCVGLVTLGGAGTSDDVAKRTGLSFERAEAARRRLVASGRLLPVPCMETPPPGRPPLTVLPGGKGAS